MSLSWDEIQGNAMSFAKRWDSREGKEKQQAQMFVREFLACFGIQDPLKNGEFERPCKKEFGDDGYIDYFSPKRIIIEMKTKGRDLKKAHKQVKDYVVHLPAEEMPPLIMVSDFDKIVITERTSGKQKTFNTLELHKHIRLFSLIAGYETSRIHENEVVVNVKAAEKMAKLHDALKFYGYEGHELEVYLVRLLFCMFAEDTAIFPQGHFTNYIENSKEDGSDLSGRISKLFEVLNLSDEARQKRKALSADLLQFRYINGGLYAELLHMPEFDATMRKTILDCCSFDWSMISPAIFGSMFQGIMDAKQRRELGAHYTSEENILKLINSLFLDDLWKEFNKVKINIKLLDTFHEKISNLIFLDPACGCGNFLIITYRELRKLEIEVLKMKVSTSQKVLDLTVLLRVNVSQFYGIEIEEFPCQVAQVGMWLMDHQMNTLAAEAFGEYYVRLPLKQSATIKHANALTMDWETVVSKSKLSYIIGNPPFIGARIMSDEQKSDLRSIFGDTKNVGNLDYVCCWYKKAEKYMQETSIQAAFVSTNSICQGEQVANLWQPLFANGIIINFAYRTFRWDNEAKGKAAVYCIIVGFSFVNKNKKTIVLEDGTSNQASNINAYLCNASPVFVESRRMPLCKVPHIGIGNKPIDDGNYLFTPEEKKGFIGKEPLAEVWFRPWIGSKEFINNIERYCLFVQDCPPKELKKMPHVLERIEAVRKFRESSTSKPTQKLAEFPLSFHVTNIPNQDYIAIPKVSSERRHYIPIGFVDADVLSGDAIQIVQNATLYHFGILTSNIHMTWMRAVAGRLKSDYRYSKEIVYNNFPWPDVTEKQKDGIEKLAQAILDARELFPESNLADLYDPLTMPVELKKAHQKLDQAVVKLYGYKKDISESDIVADLLQRYQKLVEEKG